MIVSKQMEIRSNIKKYFDLAYGGEDVLVSRIHNRNVVIMSEEKYNKMKTVSRLEAYASLFDVLVSTGSILDDNMDKLEVIRRLKDGWNGNGAPAFSDEIVDKVVGLVKGVSLQPEIFPTALNTIQLEYDNSRHDHMEIDVGESDVAQIYIFMRNGEERYEEITVDAKKVDRRVKEFYG